MEHVHFNRLRYLHDELTDKGRPDLMRGQLRCNGPGAPLRVNTEPALLWNPFSQKKHIDYAFKVAKRHALAEAVTRFGPRALKDRRVVTAIAKHFPANFNPAKQALYADVFDSLDRHFNRILAQDAVPAASMPRRDAKQAENQLTAEDFRTHISQQVEPSAPPASLVLAQPDRKSESLRAASSSSLSAQPRLRSPTAAHWLQQVKLSFSDTELRTIEGKDHTLYDRKLGDLVDYAICAYAADEPGLDTSFVPLALISAAKYLLANRDYPVGLALLLCARSDDDAERIKRVLPPELASHNALI